MRTLAFALALSIATVAALAWIARPAPPPRSPAPIAVASAPVELALPSEVSERIAVAPVPPPKIAYDPSDWLVPQTPVVLAPVDPYATARAHFRAQARVEELASRLPPDVDRSNVPSALYPDYVAAVDDANQLYAEFAAIAPPAASEPLPPLDLWARDEQLARIYRGASREDLMYEHWRIQRAAYAESKRVLDERLLHGPYEVTRRDVLIVDG